MGPLRRTARKFSSALKGIVLAVREENSFKVHSLALALVVSCSWLLGIRPVEWALLLLCCSMVIVAELINTAIEVMVKGLTQEHNHHAEKILDISAGAVLLASLFATVVSLIIFVPYFTS